MTAPDPSAAFVLPPGYRWATGGGSPIGDCNGRHIAVDDGKRGTLCGRYGPASMSDPTSPRDVPCKVCVSSLNARLRRG